MTRDEAIKHAEQIQGWMSKEELGWLYDRASEVDSIIEIGSWKGRSTYALAAACPGMVYAVDHFKGSPSEPDCHKEAINDPGSIERHFKENVIDRFWNVAKIPTSSESAARGIKWNADMIFIDGDHEYNAVKSDIESWRPKARKLFCGHDRVQNGVPKALKDCGVPYRNGPGSIWYVDLRPNWYDVLRKAYRETDGMTPKNIIQSAVCYLNHDSDPVKHAQWLSITGGSRVKNWFDSEAHQ